MSSARILKCVVVAIFYLFFSAQMSFAQEPMPSLHAGVEMGQIYRSEQGRLDVSGIMSLPLAAEFGWQRVRLSVGISLPIPAPIAGAGLHVPILMRVYPTSSGFFLLGGIRGMATLARVDLNSTEPASIEEAQEHNRTFTYGMGAQLGLGWRWDILQSLHKGIGVDFFAAYTASYLKGTSDREPTPHTGIYQGASLSCSLVLPF